MGFDFLTCPCCHSHRLVDWFEEVGKVDPPEKNLKFGEPLYCVTCRVLIQWKTDRGDGSIKGFRVSPMLSRFA